MARKTAKQTIGREHCTWSSNGKHCMKPFRHEGNHQYTVRTESRRSKKGWNNTMAKSRTGGVVKRGKRNRMRDFKEDR